MASAVDRDVGAMVGTVLGMRVAIHRPGRKNRRAYLVAPLPTLGSMLGAKRVHGKEKAGLGAQHKQCGVP